MRRRMTQGLSVVLSTAMVLSGSGIGNLSASAAAKEDSSVEASIDKAEEAAEAEEMTEAEKAEETAESEEEAESEEMTEAEDESNTDSADEGTDEESSTETPEDETEEDIEESQPEETEEVAETEEETEEEENKETETSAESEEKAEEKDNAGNEKKDEVAEEEKRETVEEKTQDTVVEEGVKKVRAAQNTRAAITPTTSDELREALVASVTNNITISQDLTLSGDKVVLQAGQSLKINSGVTLTIDADIISNGAAKNLFFTGEGIAKVVGNHYLEGRVMAGTESSNTETASGHILLSDNSYILANNSITITENSSIIINSSKGINLNTGKSLIVKGTLNSTGNGSIYLSKGAKVTDTATDVIFSDQNEDFTSESTTTIGDETTAPSATALSAGEYIWDTDKNCFTKAVIDNNITSEQLKTQLENNEVATISLDNDLIFSLDATVPLVNNITKTINIAEGKTLTITGSINSNGKDLYFTGKGTVVVEKAEGLSGKIRIGKENTDTVTCYIKDNGSIYLAGGLYMTSGTLKMDAGTKIEGNDKGQTFNIASGVTFDIADGASVILKKGYTFNQKSTGINQKFSDCGKSFIMDGTTNVVVAEETAIPADNQLTAGTYVWDSKNNYFAKSESSVDTGITEAELQEKLQSNQTETVDISENLTFSLDVTVPTTTGITKTINIAEGKTLTITGSINSNGKDLYFTGKGTVVVEKAEGLSGKIRIGKENTDTVTCHIKDNGSIYLAGGLYMTSGTLKMDAGTKIEGNDRGQTFNIASGATFDIADGASVILKKGYIFNKNSIGINQKFSDCGKSFIMDGTTNVVVAEETAIPADNQLTAGTYVWDSQNNYFAKTEAPVDTGITEAELQEKLQSEVSEDITISQDLTFSFDATVPAVDKITKTINIAEGKTLTITGSIDSNGKDLFFTGKGTVVVEKAKGLSGKIRIGKGTKGEAVTCYIKDNGSIYLAGGLYMTGGGTLKMDAGAKIEGNTKAQPWNIASGATFDIANGASVILQQGYKFLQGGTGVNQKFSDLGKSFTMDGATADVVVAEETATPADNQLTAGTYTWNGTCFYKSKTSGITTEEELIEALKGDKTDILVTENIKLMTPVTLTSNHILNVAEGKTLTITGELATGKARLTIVGKGKVLVRLKGNLSGRIYIGQENQQTPKGGYVVLNDEGKISGGNPYLANGGKLEINSPEGLSLSRNNLFTMENGGVLTGTGGMKLVEGAKVAGTSGIFSDQGSSFLVNDEVIVAAANTSPADGQLSAGVYSWNGTCFFKPVPAPLPSTGLNQGVLILSNESANRGSDEGWAWDAEKNVLNVNYRFKDVKQIQFVKSEPASIKLNADITLTPDEGTPAIVTGGNFIFRADEPYTLTVSGPIRSEGKIEFINQMLLNQTGTSEDALLHAEGDVMIKGSSRVTVSNQGNGLAVSGNAVTIKEEAELNASGKGREPVVKANGVFGIGGPNATVTAVNRGKGFSVNKAPTLADYPDAQISVSTSASGRPAAEYSAENIQDYRYVKIRKALAFNEDATVAEVENAVETLAEDDYDAIDAVIMQIHNLDEEEKAAIKPETVEKLDRLLQKATGIRPKVELSVSSSNASPNRQMKKATVYGALLALGLNTEADGADTSIEFKVEQIPPEENAYTTFTCALTINGRNALLRFPVTVKVVLPPEYFPFGADKLHLKGFRAPSMRLFSLSDKQEETAIERWLDFTYDGKDNSATFKTDILGTFSLVRQTPSGKPMPSGGGGGGSSSSGMSRSTSSGASTAGPGASGGNWVFDAVGWWYQYADQSYPSNGWFELDYSGNKDWYYFNQSGYMAVGWVLTDGRWYYLNPVSDGRMGRMLTGWQQINGKWYYFNENSDGTRGAMLTDTWIGDDYVNGDGVWEEGKKK